jgi:hypothetical protein
MCLGAHRYNSLAQFRVLRQGHTGAEAEKELPQNPMGLDPEEGFTESDKAGDVQNRVWRELVKLHAVNEERPTEKFVGRKRKTTQKKSKKHHPIAARGLGNALGARENDLISFDEESFFLSLGQISLFEFRWHPAGRHVHAILLRYLVLVRNSFYGHLQRTALGGCEEAQERKGDATMVAAEEQRTGK